MAVTLLALYKRPDGGDDALQVFWQRYRDEHMPLIETEAHQPFGADDQELRNAEERDLHRRDIRLLVVERAPQPLARPAIVGGD